MDLYAFSLALGAAGLGAMGAGGFARHLGTHGGSSAAGHALPGAPGHAVGGHLAMPHTAGHAHAVGSAPLGSARAGSAPAGSAPAGTLVQPASAPTASNAASLPGWLASFLSPRVAFGVLLGLGTAGVLLRGAVPEPIQFALALAAGLVFDRWLLTPIWNLSLRFASRPALTLETAVAGEAKAVTAFDAEGHGIVQIDLDGQLVQVLATLSTKDRALGHRVRPGEALRVEDVDPKRNRCSVTLL